MATIGTVDIPEGFRVIDQSEIPEGFTIKSFGATEGIPPGFKIKKSFGVEGSFDVPITERIGEVTEKALDILATPPFTPKRAESIKEFGLNIAKGIGNLAVFPITPIAELFRSTVAEPAKTLEREGIKPAAKQAGSALLENLQGFGEFFLNPFGFQAVKEFALKGFEGDIKFTDALKEQWLTDPVFSALGIAGLASMKSVFKKAHESGVHPSEVTAKVKEDIKAGKKLQESLQETIKEIEKSKEKPTKEIAKDLAKLEEFDLEKAGLGKKPEVVTDVRVVEEFNRREALKEQRATEIPEGFTISPPEAGSLAAGQKLPKMAINVNLNRISAPKDVKKLILDTADRYKTLIETKKQGKITLQETRNRADEVANQVGMTTDNLLKDIRKRTQNLDAHITASRDVLNSSATLLRGAMEKAIESRNPEVIQKFQEAWGRHAEIQAEVGGASSKIARALSAHRIKSKTTRAFEVLQRKMKDEIFTDAFMDRLAKVDLLDANSLNKFVRDSYKPRFKDYIYSYWYNNILSGPPTHLVNMGSNAIWAATLQGPLRFFNALVDIPVSKIQGRPREFYFREIMPAWAGYKIGLARGLSKGLETIKKGHVDSEMTKWVREMGPSANPFTYSPYKPLRKIAPAVEAPTRALIGEDLMFKGAAFQSELHAIGIRQAIKEGLKKPKNLAKRMQEIVDNPTTEQIEKASKFADFSTFTDAPGPISTIIIKGRDTIPAARLIMPFVNTIANLLKRGIELTPGLGIALELHKGVSGTQVTQLISKQALGGLITTYFLTKYLDNQLTGAAPSQIAEKESFYRTGKLPYSVRFGPIWYQYNRVEPFNTPISEVAIIGDAFREKGEIPTDEIAAKMITGIGRRLLDSSYLTGLSDAILAMERGENAPNTALRFLGRQLSGFIPYSSLLRSVTRASEAFTTGSAKLRRPRGFKETAQAGIPFLAEGIRPQVDIWGNTIKLEGGPIRQFLPWKAKTATTDPIDLEFARLKMNVSPVKKKVAGIELTDEEAFAYQVNAGKRARLMVEDLLTSEAYQNIPSDPLKIIAIRRFISIARGVEGIELLNELGYEIGEEKLIQLGLAEGR